MKETGKKEVHKALKSISFNEDSRTGEKNGYVKKGD